MKMAPEVEEFGNLRRLSPEVTGGLVRMRQKAYADGAVPGKYKVLTALALSVALRCEPCVRAYVQKLRDEYAVSLQELVELLEVAMTMQGCPGEEWALKALSLWKSSGAKNREAENDSQESCCS
jgi:AhpD family alkylhydroperoxidase